MAPVKPGMPGRSAPAKPPAARVPAKPPARVIPPAKGSKKGDNRPPKDDDAALDAMFEDSTSEVQGQDLKRISTLINEASDIEAEIEAMGEQMSALGARMEAIKGKELPDLLQQAGVKDFTDSATGTKVKLEAWLSAKWPKTPEGIKKALVWVKKVGSLDLVKNNIEASYTKGSAKAAREAVETLKKSGAATVTMEESIHSSTLVAFLKERIKQGLSVELDLFEGATGTRAKITPAKTKPGK